MPTSASRSKNPSDARADVGIRAPILPLLQQALASPLSSGMASGKIRGVGLETRAHDPLARYAHFGSLRLRSSLRSAMHCASGGRDPCSSKARGLSPRQSDAFARGRVEAV